MGGAHQRCCTAGAAAPECAAGVRKPVWRCAAGAAHLAAYRRANFRCSGCAGNVLKMSSGVVTYLYGTQLVLSLESSQITQLSLRGCQGCSTGVHSKLCRGCDAEYSAVVCLSRRYVDGVSSHVGRVKRPAIRIDQWQAIFIQLLAGPQACTVWLLKRSGQITRGRWSRACLRQSWRATTASWRCVPDKEVDSDIWGVHLCSPAAAHVMVLLYHILSQCF